MMEFTIDAISCGHCVGRVTKAIQGVDQAAQVQVDLPTHKVEVQTTADKEKIVDALKQAGYPPN
ncbi:MAG: heavy-metal-associated domain-containing protein [Candidatus Protistobacter heckmanni]|nr:heavy-metal-associated domain-containing protein [Candidatus Protistobacter heckmanni]